MPAFSDPVRAFVDVEIAAHPVPGAVVIVEASVPQRPARHAVQLAAAGAVRKAGGGDGDVALEHAGEPVAHLVVGRSQGDGAGHVGRSIQVLPARIDQQQGARFQLPFAFCAGPVMHDCAVGPGA
jgi:hypothetical protein